jgi:hypothetical protein
MTKKVVWNAWTSFFGILCLTTGKTFVGLGDFR